MRIPLRATASLVALLTLTLTGCAAGTPPTTGTDHADTMPHVHAIVPSPDGDGFLLGTHDGLYTATADGKLGTSIGSDNLDAMGLTALGGDLIASGHPGTRTPTDLGDHNLGVIRSRDGGTTWDPVAYTGEKDFHALTAAPDGTPYAQATDNNVLMASTDRGVSWTPTGSRLQVFAIAVDTTGRIIATTSDGLHVSTDRGSTFAPLPDAPNLYPLAASPDYQRLVGVDSKETIWTSSASDPTWRNVGTVHGSAQAIAITDAGDILVVDDSGLTLLPPPAAN
ncbi:hypothetical protein SAMN04489810_2415 [Microbacterium pygmaeum]|uniref:DUF6242 domain-containing protein n=2 Tax=Microbacterium pygmaeum TaxID=370764 RepID=A0A1G8ALU4_9MICO|nr:hypothetical protein SAMN04489810_2415 [Microbacterium pygmaeum]